MVFVKIKLMMVMDKNIEIYKLTSPKEQVGLPYYLKWAVSVDGNFIWAYPTKKEAMRQSETLK